MEEPLGNINLSNLRTYQFRPLRYGVSGCQSHHFGARLHGTTNTPQKKKKKKEKSEKARMCMEFL